MNTMNRYSVEDTVAGWPIQLNAYDVLLVSCTNARSPRFTQGLHVGNQRFRVLLSLFRERYLQAEMFGEESECISIAQEVLETVSQKCVPNGRFFEQRRDDRWQQFDHDSSSTITMIQNALKYNTLDDSVFERSPKRLCCRSSGFELLYKAASKELPSVPQDFVESPSPFDVVCEANGLGISRDRQHTGNNRVNVMFDLRMKSYKASTREGKQTITKEVVSSIIDDASGRFLQADKPSGKYKIVSRRSAVACIRNAIDTVAGAGKKKILESEVEKLVRRKHKKTILDRAEKRKGGKDHNLFSSFALPTRFNTFRTHNQFAPNAA